MTAQTDNTGLIERAREAAARYFENDHIDKARKAVAVLIRKGGTMDDQDATQIALYALAEADRKHAAALATKDAEVAAAYEACAKFIEDNVQVQSSVDDQPTYFAPRRGGNTIGLEYASAIRALGAKP